MQEITQEYLKSLFNYKNGFLYWKIRKARCIQINDKTGTLHKRGYYRIKIDDKMYSLHRLIYLYHNGYLPKELDHIDGNPSNNKIENLREVTQSQNMMNKIKRKNTSSKYKGVSWHKRDKKWQANIVVNRKQKYLGSFNSEINAAKAYNDAAKKYFKEYAKLNEV